MLAIVTPKKTLAQTTASFYIVRMMENIETESKKVRVFLVVEREKKEIKKKIVILKGA